jgi:uncharacterized protein
MEPGSFPHTMLYRDGRLRPPWRILIFFLFFFLLAAAGSVAISVLPRHPLQWAGLIVMTLAALVAGWILLIRVEARPPGALGFPLHVSAIRETFGGLAIGGALIGAAVLLLLVTGSARFASDGGTVGAYLGFVAWTLLFFGIAAAFEEVIFRGYPFQVLVEWIGAWPATLIASALFSALHAQNPNITALAFVNIFLAGVLLSVAYLKTRSLWFATGVHVGWNWTMASMLDFPVSGLGFDTPLYSGVATGPDWWTGGAFGPEAGVVGTIVAIGGSIWIVASRRIRSHPVNRQLEPIVERNLSSEVLR